MLGTRVLLNWSRRSTIVPERWFNYRSSQWEATLTCFVTEAMVGHKLGEFSPTRTFKGHPGQNNGNYNCNS